MAKVVCCAINYQKNACSYFTLPNNKYCRSHNYFNDFTKDEINAIKEGKYKVCTRCHRWQNTEFAHCAKCKKNQTNYQKDKVLLKDKCRGIDRHGDECRNDIKFGHFCEYHKYMKDYTKDMMDNLTKCTGCLKYKFLDGGTCDECKARAKETRKKTKALKIQNRTICKYIWKTDDGERQCEFKCCDNGYCQKHQIQGWVDDIFARGKKPCNNYLRGCRIELEKDYKYSRCDECRKKEREEEKNRRDKILDKKQEITETLEDDKYAVCRVKSCKKVFEKFMVKTGESTICPKCHEKQRIAESKRDRSNRDYTNDNRDPEKRANWKLINHDKIHQSWIANREKSKEQMGIDEYRKRNAELARKWRERNPEKTKEQLKKDKMNSKRRLYSLIRQAEIKNHKWKLNDDYAIKMIESVCFYCNEISTECCNGIDRLNNEEYYDTTNCVSSCSMCNYMKKDLSPLFFLNKIEHILTHLKLIDGNLHPETHQDRTKKDSYQSYKSKSIRRKIDFQLTENEYNNIINQQCYLCGQQNTVTHHNSIDRVDNDIGYINENCKSCCKVCNYLKRDYPYEDFINRITKIHENRENVLKNIEIVQKGIYYDSNNIINHSEKDDLIEEVPKKKIKQPKKKPEELFEAKQKSKHFINNQMRTILGADKYNKLISLRNHNVKLTECIENKNNNYDKKQIDMFKKKLQSNEKELNDIERILDEHNKNNE